MAVGCEINGWTGVDKSSKKSGMQWDVGTPGDRWRTTLQKCQCGVAALGGFLLFIETLHTFRVPKCTYTAYPQVLFRPVVYRGYLLVPHNSGSKGLCLAYAVRTAFSGSSIRLYRVGNVQLTRLMSYVDVRSPSWESFIRRYIRIKMYVQIPYANSYKRHVNSIISGTVPCL